MLSNRKRICASNIEVSGAKRFRLLVALVSAIAVGPCLNATPIRPTAKQLLRDLQRPPAMFVPARVGWDSPHKPIANFNLTMEQYGPQATARAVRASLLVALVPDPTAMAALIFCAFALRWMRMRKSKDENQERQNEASPAPAPELLLPKAA